MGRASLLIEFHFQASQASERQPVGQRRTLHPCQDPVPRQEVVAALRKVKFRIRLDRPEWRKAERWPF
jgi:hypothetical protein